MTGLLEALAASAPAAFLRTSFLAYPIVNAAHILGLGVLVTGALLMDLRLLGWGGSIPAERVVAVLRPLTIGALAAVIATGGLLFSVRPTEYAANPAFLAKMGLLALAILNAAAFTLGAGGSRVAETGGRRAMLVGSLLLWPAVLVAGRFIGFLE